LIAYQTAWLKAHYPAQFMAASMTADMNNTDKIIPLKEDCIDLDIELLQPCVNHSGYGFIVQDSEPIRYGLGAIKGIGESAAEAITDERLKNGDYKDFFDFCSRLSDQKLSKRTIEALIKSGAMDCFNENRSTLFQSIETGVNFANKKAMDRKSGQNNLFSIDGAQAETPPSLNRGKEWKLNDLLQGEFQSLGFYFSGHPFDPYRKDCIHLTKGPLIQIKAMMETSNGSQRFDSQYSMDIAGLVFDVKRRGNNLVFRLDDGTAIIDAIVFGENKDRFRDLINNNAVLHLNGSFRYDTYADTWQFVASEVLELNVLIEKRAKTLLIKCDSDFDPEKLKSILQAHTPGSCEVNVHYKTDIDVYKLQFGQEWTVKVTKELRDRLTVEFGSGNFQFLTHH
jgi:DNA polymerase-3 subunit alpha